MLLAVCGALVNGPYCLITTAVSADLGTHPSLHGNNKALATVTAIIDGTGSMGQFPWVKFLLGRYGHLRDSIREALPLSVEVW